MNEITRPFAVVLMLICGVPAALALEDSAQNRAAQADYYLRTTPPKALFEDMADKVGASLPESQRAQFKALMTKHIDIEALTKAMRGALIKSFSADELKALGDFYGSPIGKSAMSKFGNYMAEIMPAMQAEMAKAISAAQSEMARPK